MSLRPCSRRNIFKPCRICAIAVTDPRTIPIQLSIGLLAAIICLGATGFAAAQARDARQVIDEAFNALGGEAKIRSFKSIYYSAKGFEDSEVNAQPYQPGRGRRLRHEEKLAVFLDGRRLAYELRTDRGDGTERWRRFYFPDTRRLTADFGTRAVYGSGITYPSTDRDQDARRIPHTFLLELSANAARLEYRRQDAEDVVTVTLPGAQVPISVYFDTRTHLMNRYEFTADFPGLGTSKIEYIFADQRPHPSLGTFHGTQEIRINGRTFRSIKIDNAAVDSSEADAMLTLPPDMEGFLIPSGTAKQIAPRIYYLYDIRGFQPMFIEFDDYIMAIEAPAGVPSLEETPVETMGDPSVTTKEFIAKIKQTVPNKPIRYIVITHAHADHYGGLRAFIPEKTTILTTPGNKELFQKFVPELSIEVIPKNRTFTDGRTTVDLINVGPNPHTQENLIAWFPREKYLFQGDLFYFANEATFPPIDRMTVMPFFARWLKANKIVPERIYGFHGPMFATMTHVEKVLRMASQGGKKK